MTEGERILYDAQIRALGAAALLGTMRKVMEEGSWAAEMFLKGETERQLTALPSRSPDFLKAFGITNSELTQSEIESFAAKSARDDVESAFALLTASEIIFYHTLVDEAAWDCCRAIAAFRPEALDVTIRQRKVAFEELARVGTAGVRSRLIAETVDQLKKESLIERVALIMRVCRPRRPHTELKEYRFKGRRLKRLDTLRHDLVHGLKVEALKGLEDGDLTFLSLTPLYLTQVVADHFEVTFDVEYTKPRVKAMLLDVSKRARVSGRW